MFDFLKKFTSKKIQEDPNSFLSQIKTHMVTLKEKSGALPEIYSAEKNKINNNTNIM